MKKSLNDVTKEIAMALGDRLLDFSTVVLGEIERGVRPATMEQLEAMSHVLDVSIDTLKQHAIEWHESVWDGEPKYELQPGETDVRTIHPTEYIVAMDELRGALEDMRRGARMLSEVQKVIEDTYPELAQRSNATHRLLLASCNRIGGVLNPERAKANFAGDEEDRD